VHQAGQVLTRLFAPEVNKRRKQPIQENGAAQQSTLLSVQGLQK
jgi:hypothetical protein